MNLSANTSEFINELQINLETYYAEIITLIPKLIIGFLLILIWWIVSRAVKRKLVGQLTRRSGDPLMIRFIGRFVMAALMTVGVLLFLKIVGLGSIATGILGSVGVSAFIIGFAFKDIGEHFIAGFILAFNRPFRVGDLVELSGEKGKVIELNIRNTHLKTFDGRDLYIPNGNIIKGTLVNYTIDGFMRQEFTLGLDYGADVHLTIKTILDAMDQVSGILKADKKPSVGISDLGASSINLTVYYWLDTFDKTVNGSAARIDAVASVLKSLGEKGIYLPGDIIELKNYNQEAVKTVAGISAA